MAGAVSAQNTQVDMDVILQSSTPDPPNMVVSPRSDSIMYTGDKIGVNLEWDTGNSLERVDVYNCNGKFVTSWTEEFGPASSPLEGQLEFSEPYDSQCSLGRDTYNLEAQFASGVYGEEEFYINTVPKRGIQQIYGDDYGAKMVINLRPSNQLRAFQFTNDFEITQKTDFTGNYNEVDIYAQRKGTLLNPFNNDEQNSFKAKPGTIISPTESVEPLLNNSCSDGPVCNEVIKQGFTTEGSGDAAVWSDLSSIYPIHENDNYRPMGEVAFAYHPKHANLKNIDGELADEGRNPLFFVCTDSNEMENYNGNYVPRVIDMDKENQELYKCNTDTNEWEPTNECEDRLDNDGDGNIDEQNDFTNVNADEQCQIADDESATVDGCDTAKVYERTAYEPQFGEEIGIGEYYAKYKTGDGCKKTNYTDWDWVENGEPKSPNEYSCNINDDPNNPDCSDDLGEDGWDEMPHVEYGAHAQYFEQLAEAKGKDIQEDGVKTKFVEQNNGWVTQRQGLYTAEKLYDPGQITGGLGGGSCDTRTLENGTVQDCQSYSWWNSLNMTNLDGYQESGTYGHKDAWNTYNAGANTTNEIDSDIGSPFRGGFAGNCIDGFKWMDTTLTSDFSSQFWKCEGERKGGGGVLSTSENPPIEVPGIQPSVVLPETSLYGGTREIGLILMPYLHKDSRPDHLPNDVKTYDELMQGTEYDGDNIESMDVECWAGNTSEQPDDCTATDRCFQEENVPVSSSDPYGTSQEVNSGGETNYACAWRYNTEQRSDHIVGDSLIELHKQSSRNQYPGFWDDLTLSEHDNLREDYTDGGLAAAFSSWN